jgi:hypothetical protein
MKLLPLLLAGALPLVSSLNGQTGPATVHPAAANPHPAASDAHPALSDAHPAASGINRVFPEDPINKNIPFSTPVPALVSPPPFVPGIPGPIANSTVGIATNANGSIVTNAPFNPAIPTVPAGTNKPTSLTVP